MVSCIVVFICCLMWMWFVVIFWFCRNVWMVSSLFGLIMWWWCISCKLWLIDLCIFMFMRIWIFIVWCMYWWDVWWMCMSMCGRWCSVLLVYCCLMRLCLCVVWLRWLIWLWRCGVCRMLVKVMRLLCCILSIMWILCCGSSLLCLRVWSCVWFWLMIWGRCCLMNIGSCLMIVWRLCWLCRCWMCLVWLCWWRRLLSLCIVWVWRCWLMVCSWFCICVWMCRCLMWIFLCFLGIRFMGWLGLVLCMVNVWFLMICCCGRVVVIWLWMWCLSVWCFSCCWIVLKLVLVILWMWWGLVWCLIMWIVLVLRILCVMSMICLCMWWVCLCWCWVCGLLVLCVIKWVCCCLCWRVMKLRKLGRCWMKRVLWCVWGIIVCNWFCGVLGLKLWCGCCLCFIICVMKLMCWWVLLGDWWCDVDLCWNRELIWVLLIVCVSFYNFDWI